MTKSKIKLKKEKSLKKFWINKRKLELRKREDSKKKEKELKKRREEHKTKLERRHLNKLKLSNTELSFLTRKIRN